METRLKIANGAIRDQIRQEIYDTITIAAAESPIGDRSFFSNVQGKAKYLTNLRQNNMLEGQVSYRVQGLSIDAHNYDAAMFAALPLIMEHSALKFRVGEKIYFEGPMRFACGKINTLNPDFVQFGAPKFVGLVFKGNETVDLAPLQTFVIDWSCAGMSAAEVVLATPVAGGKLSFVSALRGLMRRPVQ